MAVAGLGFKCGDFVEHFFGAELLYSSRRRGSTVTVNRGVVCNASVFIAERKRFERTNFAV